MFNLSIILLILCIYILITIFKFQIKYTYTIFLINIIYAILITTTITAMCILNYSNGGPLFILLLMLASIDTIIYLSIYKN